jgi:peptidoglycan L-alanyl-D-glutamate endopeptidase CwlK
VTDRDRERLKWVHFDLVLVVEAAMKETPCFVLEGVRTIERQRELFAKGATRTLNSRHLTGHAVDLAPTPLDWNDLPAFKRMASVVKRKADELGVEVIWGGDWRSFYDGPHFELDRRKYP